MAAPLRGLSVLGVGVSADGAVSGDVSAALAGVVVMAMAAVVAAKVMAAAMRRRVMSRGVFTLGSDGCGVVSGG